MSWITTGTGGGSWSLTGFAANKLGYSTGHDFLYMTGALDSDPNAKRIGYMNSQLFNTGSTFGGSKLRKPVALASVVAPEPGTLLALGTGLAVLVHRRRTRRA